MQQPPEKYPQTFLRLLIELPFFWWKAMLYAWNAMNLWIKRNGRTVTQSQTLPFLEASAKAQLLITLYLAELHQAYHILHNNYLWLWRGVLGILNT